MPARWGFANRPVRARLNGMSNPDGHPQQTPPPGPDSVSDRASGSTSAEPTAGGYEAPPIEQSTTPPGHFPPPAYEQPGYSPQGYPQQGYQQSGYEQSGTSDYPPPPAFPPPVPGYGPAYPPPPPSYGAYGSPYDTGGYPPPYGGGYPGTFASPRTNQLAIWSLVASLLGFICCVGSVAGVVLGVMSLNQIKQHSEGGRGLAIAGIAVGALTLLVSFVIWGAVISKS